MKNFFISILLVNITLGCLGQCFIGGFGSLGELSKTTGNYSLDNWFNIQKTAIEKVFDVTADLYIYNDYNGANAYATTSSYADGKIAFGVNMLTEYLWRMDKGKAGVAAVLAHEYAHVLQLVNDSDLDWKYRELHADYLAGFYLKTKSYITYSELNNFAGVFYDLGDDAFWSDSHHGTKIERLNAFKAGYNCNCYDADDAYDKGEDYVLGNNRRTYQEERYTTCPKCNGYGVLTSHSNCGSCNGYGQLICATCAGNGGYWYYGQWVYCSGCSGTGRLVCGSCYGNGQISNQHYCDRCSGTGQVKY